MGEIIFPDSVWSSPNEHRPRYRFFNGILHNELSSYRSRSLFSPRRQASQSAMFSAKSGRPFNGVSYLNHRFWSANGHLSVVFLLWTEIVANRSFFCWISAKHLNNPQIFRSPQWMTCDLASHCLLVIFCQMKNWLTFGLFY